MNDFTALVDELAAWRAHRDRQDAARAMATSSTMSKAMPPLRRDAPRQTVPLSYFSKGAAIASGKAARRDIERSAADLAKMERQVRDMAAQAVAAGAGERRARIRSAVEDILRRAMEGVARGTVTALEVAKIEGQAMRLLAAIETGPRIARA